MLDDVLGSLNFKSLVKIRWELILFCGHLVWVYRQDGDLTCRHSMFQYTAVARHKHCLRMQYALARLAILTDEAHQSPPSKTF